MKPSAGTVAKMRNSIIPSKSKEKMKLISRIDLCFPIIEYEFNIGTQHTLFNLRQILHEVVATWKIDERFRILSDAQHKQKLELGI